MSEKKRSLWAIPEWVMGVSGWMVPNVSPEQIKQDAIRDARVAREKAQAKLGFASQPVSGPELTRERSRERG